MGKGEKFATRERELMAALAEKDEALARARREAASNDVAAANSLRDVEKLRLDLDKISVA